MISHRPVSRAFRTLFQKACMEASLCANHSRSRFTTTTTKVGSAPSSAAGLYWIKSHSSRSRISRSN